MPVLSAPGAIAGGFGGAVAGGFIGSKKHYKDIAMRGDPEAQGIMGKARQISPDDAMVQAKIRQFGGTPDAPLPIGGKHQRGLEQAISQKAPELSRGARVSALQAGAAGMHVPYVPPETAAAYKSISNPATWKQTASNITTPLKQGKFLEGARAVGGVRDLLGNARKVIKFTR